MERHVHIYLGWDARMAEGESLYGKNERYWKYQCPACGGVYRAADFWDNECDIDPGDLVFSECLLCEFEIDEHDYSKPHTARWLFNAKEEFDGDPDEDIDLAGIDFYREEFRKKARIYIGWDEYYAEGVRLFGEDRRKWEVQCPSCLSICAVGEHAPEDANQDSLEMVLDAIAMDCPWCDHALPKKDWDEKGLAMLHSAKLVLKTDDECDHDAVCPVFDFYRGNDPRRVLGKEPSFEEDGDE